MDAQPQPQPQPRNVTFALDQNRVYRIAAQTQLRESLRPYRTPRRGKRCPFANGEADATELKKVVRSMERVAHANAIVCHNHDTAEAVMVMLGKMRWSQYKSLWAETGVHAQEEDRRLALEAVEAVCEELCEQVAKANPDPPAGQGLSFEEIENALLHN